VSRRLSVNNASPFRMYQHGIYSFDAHTFSMLLAVLNIILSYRRALNKLLSAVSIISLKRK